MKQTTNHILVPLDFSKQSIIALEQSYNLARLSGSEIVLLHVVRENNAVFGLFSENEQKDMMLRLKNKLDDFARKAMEQSQLEINTILTRGKVVDQIIETAEHLDAQFIIMGTHRPENIMKRIIGSTALRVIKEAKCPVISIEGIHHRKGCSNIVLPMDLKKEIIQKIGVTIKFAKLFGSKISVVSVKTKDDELQTIKRLEQLEQVKKQIVAEGIECETTLLEKSGNNESIATDVLDFAHDVKGDLIVLMTQQENEIKDFFIGSFAKEIIHKSKIPVMSMVPKRK